ncbi:nitrogen regulatory protein P-II 1 [Burkholderia sp. THE68]|uniref:P-II family nitrogen regulator n=1 Tax=Burkholderia sp. THE68 TaxID=758782 RepID=UPI00131691F1|nr:P-II family nitrogen regulator [Burkholderia sp. THE68]BBU30196.1 nitrogen regulatory protein P-II 1 [Burkholderia sp. THE68]
MELRCVVAIVRPEVLKVLERRLGTVHVHGLTVTRVKGFGAHPNPFANDWTTEHIKIEIFTESERVDALVKEIMDAARDASGDEGILAVFPVERFFRVRTASEAVP